MKKLKKLGIIAGTIVAGTTAAMAETDATTIVTSATTAFGSIATLCVSIGTFFVVYRLVRRVG